MWVVGNEWNYNGLYNGMGHAESLARINAVASLVREVDASRPIATVYGEMPTAETLSAMPNIDVWGLNVYRGLGFGDLFQQWQARSTKPMFLAEYGADAWNANIPGPDFESQAHATSVLTQLLVDESAALGNGVSSGGTVFAWADEWWKAGNPSVHDSGGSAPGGGPYPDQVFNEEWWGVVDVDRELRPAYDALAAIYRTLGPTPGAAR
jgi:hypothetical protein